SCPRRDAAGARDVCRAGQRAGGAGARRGGIAMITLADQLTAEAHTRVVWRRSVPRRRESLGARRGVQRREHGIEAVRFVDTRAQFDGAEVHAMTVGTQQEGVPQAPFVQQDAYVAHTDATRMLVT